MPRNHDKDTPIKALASALEVGLSTIYRRAEEMSLPTVGRSAEQHAELVAAITLGKQPDKKPASRREKPIAVKATRKPPVEKTVSTDVRITPAPSQFSSVVEGVVGVLRALEGLTPNLRKAALEMASACVDIAKN